MKWKPARSVAENAGALLPRMAEKYFKAGRKAAAHARPSPKDLHRVRLRTKRLRYSLELFRPVYGASLDRYLNQLRALQDVLGKLSDYHTLHALFTGHPELETRMDLAARQQLKKFRKAWVSFDSKGQLERWMKYLALGG
jgi:CHAD domain-containing protein